MEIPSCRGPVGIHIREYGLAARIFRSGSASGLASSGVSGGAGTIGDSIGTIATQDLAAVGITPKAGRSITGTITIVEEARVAERLPEATSGVGLPPEILADAAMFSTVPARRPGPLTETRKPPEGTLNPAVRPASVQAHSAASPRVGRHEAFPRAEAPALVGGRCGVVEVEDFAAAVAVEPEAGVAAAANRSCVTTRVLIVYPMSRRGQGLDFVPDRS